MRSALTAVAAIAALLLGLGAHAAFAGGVQVVAPGHLTAQTIPAASGNCWTGSPTFTPAQPVGSPKAYRKVIVTGAFAACVGQYADLSVNVGSTQLDVERNYLLGSGDASGFTISLTKGTFTAPAPAGTSYTLVIHP